MSRFGIGVPGRAVGCHRLSFFHVGALSRCWGSPYNRIMSGADGGIGFGRFWGVVPLSLLLRSVFGDGAGVLFLDALLFRVGGGVARLGSKIVLTHDH